MAYKPQPGMRKHKQLIGDCVAMTDFVIDDCHILSKAARNPATALHIARMENQLRGIQVNLYAMLSILQDSTATEA